MIHFFPYRQLTLHFQCIDIHRTTLLAAATVPAKRECSNAMLFSAANNTRFFKGFLGCHLVRGKAANWIAFRYDPAATASGRDQAQVNAAIRFYENWEGANLM